MIRHAVLFLSAVAGATALCLGAAGSAGAVKPISPGPGVYVWGMINNKTGLNYDTPTPVTGVPGTVEQVASTNSNFYILNTAGKVYSLGAVKGLGDNAKKASTTPKLVQIPTGVQIARVAQTAPDGTALAIDTNGNAWGWGWNSYGQLCLDNATYQPVPVELPFTNVSLVAGAGDHSVIVSNGTVYTCGRNSHGDLGIGSTTPSFTPVPVPDLPATAPSDVVAGWSNGGALYPDGSYFDWGYNGRGEIGNGTMVDATTPQLVESGVAQVTQGGGGPVDGQSLAVLTDGSTVGWGADGSGQICGTSPTKAVISPITLDPPVPWKAAYSGGDTSYGIDTNGSLWDCGNNESGQLGIGSISAGKTGFKDVLNGVAQFSTTNFKAIAWVQ